MKLPLQPFNSFVFLDQEIDQSVDTLLLRADDGFLFGVKPVHAGDVGASVHHSHFATQSDVPACFAQNLFIKAATSRFVIFFSVATIQSSEKMAAPKDLNALSAPHHGHTP